MNWKTLRVASVFGLGVLALVVFTFSRPLGHRMTLKAYFTDATGLRPSATVRIAGVDVGGVKSVRVRPEMKDTSVEVVMSLNAAQDLSIPNDSTVSLETAGVLGEIYIDIDSRSASGPPIQSGGTLKATPTVTLTTEQMIEKLAEVLNLSKTEQTLDKLEAVIKERCKGESDQSEAVSKPKN
jgi:phospholipid/cholesterol/gamma-HCH transport system substrate-binding protein